MLTPTGSFLIVRLGSLGDIVHALPVAAALREAFPRARIDWVVDVRHRELLDLVPVLDRRIALAGATLGIRGLLEAIQELRRGRYDVAIDLQGLLKSAVLARASGARRVLGFGVWHLRERTARPFYTETGDVPGGHVIDKNLALLALVGVSHPSLNFPLEISSKETSRIDRFGLPARYAILNAGGGWPNKRWPPDRFGALAIFLERRYALPSLVLWGPGEAELASQVVAHSGGNARVAPETSIADLVAVTAGASLMVSGDTGPLHIAASRNTPLVGIYGPTNPARNGPWAAEDVTVSRFEQCECHHKRRCRAARWCLADVSVAEVEAAIDKRLAVSARAVSSS